MSTGFDTGTGSEFEVWTPEEASNVAGDIVVPEDASIGTIKLKGKPVQVYKWWETVVVTGMTEPKATPDERLGGTQVEWVLFTKQAGASFPSENTDKRMPGFRYRVNEGLRNENKAKLKEAKDRAGDGTIESQRWGAYMGLTISAQNMAKLFRALGRKDVLEKGVNWAGIGSVTDILPELEGLQFDMQLQNGDLWGDGSNRTEPSGDFRPAS